jgi:hypothetical protein
MDICGPLKETQSGNKYILVISDYFTKYTEAYPMQDQTAETIANILIREWFVKKGPPEELHTDQGTNFESKLIQEICRLYDIDKTRTTPYHPQSDGQVERFNRSLMDILSNLQNKYGEWDQALPFAYSSYNATIHESTNYTPNFLWYGRELRNTVGNLVPCVEEPFTKLSDYTIKLKEQIKIAHDVTRQHLKKSALKSKRYYDKNVHYYRYRAGDQVMCRDHTKTEKGTKKFKRTYEGPYWVIEQLGDVVYRVQKDVHSASRCVHHNQLRRYNSRVIGPIFVPTWVRLKSKHLKRLETGEVKPCTGIQTRAPPLRDTWAERRRRLRKLVRPKLIPHKLNTPKKRSAPGIESEEIIDPPSQEPAAPPEKRTRSGRIITKPARFR